MQFTILFVTVLCFELTLAVRATETIPLPLGFGPEGITRGKGNRLFVGNFRNGAIYSLNVRTNRSRVIVKPFDSRIAVGLAARNRKLFVAGGGEFPFGTSNTGFFYVYNTRTGKEIAACNITGASFLNDVTIRFNKAYFSDSFSAKVVVVPIKTVRKCKFNTVKLPQAFRPAGDGQARGNGIEFFKGRVLVANTAERTVYSVDPKGRERARPIIPLGSVRVPDGLVVKNRKLYIVDPLANNVRVWLLRKRSGTGRIKARKLRSIRSDTFTSPTTAALLKGRLYVVNSRFGDLGLDADVSHEEFTISIVPTM